MVGEAYEFLKKSFHFHILHWESRSPKDKKYYRGIVHAFDAKSKRRHVVYDDGDEEKTLDFERERILLPLWDKSQVMQYWFRGHTVYFCRSSLLLSFFFCIASARKESKQDNTNA